MIKIIDIYSSNNQENFTNLSPEELTSVVGGYIGEYAGYRQYGEDPVTINDISEFLSKIDNQVQSWWSKIDGTSVSFRRGFNI